MSIIKRMLKIGLIAVFILTIGRWTVFSFFPVFRYAPGAHIPMLFTITTRLRASAGILWGLSQLR